ncbi:MAG: S24 family peptidase, partial [Alistipes sp.]|nr:S24 family peptidase [Alistipes sp.]
ENLYQIKAGKNGISRALGSRIVEYFPEISLGWLLSGEGDMFGRREDVRSVPFYDGDLSSCLVQRREGEPDSVFVVPTVVDCDIAIRSCDDAMAGEVVVGSILFLKKIDPEAIISGGLYVIVCPNYVLLRRVRVADECLRLEPANKDYDVIEVFSQQVEAIYRVKGNLRLY